MAGNQLCPLFEHVSTDLGGTAQVGYRLELFAPGRSLAARLRLRWRRRLAAAVESAAKRSARLAARPFGHPLRRERDCFVKRSLGSS